MQYNFDQLPDRKSTESIKWNYFEPDVLPMWVADMDFVSPQPVIRALQERADHGVFGYALDVPGLREVIVERLERLYQWQVQPNEIVYVPGVVTGFQMAAHAFVGSGGGLLIQPPVYMPFLDVATNVKGIQQDAQLVHHGDGSYSVDWDVFENAIDAQTKMFLLCNPHNPVGRVFTRPELERMAEICQRHDLVICSDEIHSDLVYSGHRHIPIATLGPEIAERTITFMAPSKTFNVAGLSFSFAVIQNPKLRKQFTRGSLGMVHGTNLLGMVAGKAAYSEGQEWLDQLLPYLEGNRDLLYRFVNEELPGIKMFQPEGTYLAWLDCREANLGQKPCEFFLDKARVGTSDGASFGQGGEGFLRLNFGCPRPMLMDALNAMKRALVEWA